ncbi:stamen-specific protein FIL1 [Sesamum indicum]|uniref:Stamen-specific protein FIL1 n=1 Tax=Sesamum indicum TaxID=4182 RepID=A0A6I9V0R3_SESIN|nr:stamen-specific protein FIL1 [Sesamum indicum]
MAITKSVLPLVMLVALVSQSQLITAQFQAQTCSSSLSSLNVCAPFAVPGSSSSTTPSPECCGALQAIDHDCMCSTLRIASQIPTQCNLPPLNCGGN